MTLVRIAHRQKSEAALEDTSVDVIKAPVRSYAVQSIESVQVVPDEPRRGSYQVCAATIFRIFNVSITVPTHRTTLSVQYLSIQMPNLAPSDSGSRRRSSIVFADEVESDVI